MIETTTSHATSSVPAADGAGNPWQATDVTQLTEFWTEGLLSEKEFTTAMSKLLDDPGYHSGPLLETTIP